MRSAADDIHYPGTYLAGGYNRLRTDIAGRVVENEDLVNFPNWLALGFRIAGQVWFDARSVKAASIEHVSSAADSIAQFHRRSITLAPLAGMLTSAFIVV